jgi:hypothetical protein
MKRKTQLLWAVLILFTMMTACAETQDKNSGGSGADNTGGGDNKKLILGSWKLVAVHCDKEGNNCEWYTDRRVFQFSRNGDLVINDEKRGTYQVEGSACILDNGSKRYSINIIQLDSSKLMTGESYRSTTEIFKKIK